MVMKPAPMQPVKPGGWALEVFKQLIHWVVPISEADKRARKLARDIRRKVLRQQRFLAIREAELNQLRQLLVDQAALHGPVSPANPIVAPSFKLGSKDRQDTLKKIDALEQKIYGDWWLRGYESAPQSPAIQHHGHDGDGVQTDQGTLNLGESTQQAIKAEVHQFKARMDHLFSSSLPPTQLMTQVAPGFESTQINKPE